MKTLNLILAVLVVAISNAFVVKKADRYVADTAESKVEWVAKKVTGQHNGFVAVKSGELLVKDGKIEGGEFVMDMNSLTCTDLTGEWGDKLLGHLKSDDFFSTAKFGTATLKVKKATAKGGNVHSIEADLTIKGITQAITFDATVDIQGKKLTANSNITVNRTKYDIKYRSGSFFENLGDKMIYDDFTLNVTLVGKAS